MILIVAYGLNQARDTAFHMGLRPEQWRLVTREEDLLGTRGVHILVTESAWRRTDYHIFETLFRQTSAIVWYEEDYGRRPHKG